MGSTSFVCRRRSPASLSLIVRRHRMSQTFRHDEMRVTTRRSIKPDRHRGHGSATSRFCWAPLRWRVLGAMIGMGSVGDLRSAYSGDRERAFHMIVNSHVM